VVVVVVGWWWWWFRPVLGFSFSQAEQYFSKSGGKGGGTFRVRKTGYITNDHITIQSAFLLFYIFSLLPHHLKMGNLAL